MMQLDFVNEFHLDEDGYPTDDCLEFIKTYQPKNYETSYTLFLDFIETVWNWADVGWHKHEPEVDYYEPSYQVGNLPKVALVKRTKTRYNISALGWSGNESIVRALEQNDIFWSMCWVFSRRGGHYKFEVQDLENISWRSISMCKN